MEAGSPHRKRVKHYEEPGHAHLLTFSCFDRRPLLTNDLWRAWLSRSIDSAAETQGFRLVGFVYMPEHVHLLMWPEGATYDIGRLLAAIKRPTSFRVKAHLVEQGSPLVEQLTVQERPGKMAFRFWQEGPGHDRNVLTHEAALEVVEYLHGNPVRRGLCASPDEWRWSSWRRYHGPDAAPDPDLPRVTGFPGDAGAESG